nr:site-specific DNA-methyltransferase [Methanospirillum sp.]
MKKDSLTPKQNPVLIEIPLSRDLLQKELSVLHSLNRKYSGKEIALDVRDQTLIAQLWKLDP